MHTEMSTYCSEMPDHTRFCAETRVRTTVKSQVQIGEVRVRQVYLSGKYFVFRVDGTKVAGKRVCLA